MDDDARIRSLQDRVSELEVTISQMRGTQEQYVPFVENMYEQLLALHARQKRIGAGLARLDEKHESWKQAQIALALGRPLGATGSEGPELRPAGGGPVRHRHRERPPWLRVVKVFPLIAGATGAGLLHGGKAAGRHKVHLGVMAATAALLGGGVAAVPVLSYRPVPQQVAVTAPPQVGAPAGLVTEEPTPSPSHGRRRRHREAPESPSPSPLPSSSGSASPLPPVPVPTVTPLPSLTPSLIPSPLSTAAAT